MASFKKVNGFLDRNAASLFISCIFTCDDLFICSFHSSNTWKVYIHHFNIRFVGHTVQTLRETKLFSGDLTSRVYHKIHISSVCVSCCFLLQSFFCLFDLLLSMLIDAKNWTDNYSVNEHIKNTFLEYLISLVCMCYKCFSLFTSNLHFSICMPSPLWN